MPVTAQQLATAWASLQDYHERGVKDQALQARPLYDDLVRGMKTFPGGREYITMRINGRYEVVMTGYSYDDEVGYTNPGGPLQARAKWYETHSGIEVTLTELKQAGISVVDSLNSERTVTHTEAERVALADLLEFKMNQLIEGSTRSLAEMLWRDGSQDVKVIPGISSFIVDTPTLGTRFGIDASAETYWRNRVNLAIDAATPANQNLVTTLQGEFRQLRRYGNPRHKFYSGSDFMEAFESELRAKGNYTMEGWARTGTIDAGMADVSFKGVALVYEPLLDDLGKSKYAYLLDLNAIRLWAMEGEWMKSHEPARPAEKYVLYRARTCTAGLLANQLNTSGVYAIQ